MSSDADSIFAHAWQAPPPAPFEKLRLPSRRQPAVLVAFDESNQYRAVTMLRDSKRGMTLDTYVAHATDPTTVRVLVRFSAGVNLSQLSDPERHPDGSLSVVALNECRVDKSEWIGVAQLVASPHVQELRAESRVIRVGMAGLVCLLWRTSPPRVELTTSTGVTSSFVIESVR